MSWQTPRTWTTGEPVTVWKLNRELRDNVLSLRNLNEHAVSLTLNGDDLDLPDGQNLVIPWTDAQWQIGTEIWSSGQGERLLAPVSGWYELRVNAEFRADTGGEKAVGYKRNDSNLIYDLAQLDCISANSNNISGLDTVQLQSGQYVVIVVRQHSGAGLDDLVTGNVDQTRCTWRLLGTST